MTNANDRNDPQYSVLDHLREGVMVCGPDGRVVAANAVACGFLGASPDQIIGKEAADPGWGLRRADGGALPFEEHPVSLALAHKRPVKDVPLEVPGRAGGETFWLVMSAFPEMGAGGGVSRVVVTMALSEAVAAAPPDHLGNDRSLAAVFLASPIGIGVIRLSDEAFMDANEALVSLVNRTRQEVLGHSYAELGITFEPDAQARMTKELERFGCIANFELGYRLENGQSGVALASTELVDFGGDLCALTFLTDITDRKRAEEALRESEARFRTLIEAAPDGIFIHTGGPISYANRTLVQMLGAESAESMVGVECWSFVGREYWDVVRGRIELTSETGGPHAPLEQEYVRMDGSRIPVEVSAVVLRGSPDQAHMVFVRDITERKKVEAERESLQRQLQQSQKMESVGQLAGGIAHDFNNILMVQRGYCEMMRATLRPGDPLEDDLAQIEACTQRAAGLTGQLLAFSRKQTLQPRLLDLNAVVTNLTGMLRRVIGEEIELKAELPERPAMVNADPGQLEQVLVNLAVNARDATGSGGSVTIAVSHSDGGWPRKGAEPELPSGAYVRLAVTDTGRGMTEEVKSRVFEPFFTTKPEGKGTGLGLSTVHGIVLQSGGDITVTSELGRGTTFTILLPEAGAGESELPASEPEAERGQGELILVVEDEPALRRLAVIMLEKLGFRAVGAENGGAALMLVEEEGLRPDLIVTDVVMPGMHGGVLVERLRKTLPGAKVIFMSGYTEDSILDEKGGAAVQFLQKPYSIASLSAAIEAALAEA